MLGRLVKIRQCLVNTSSLDNACSTSQAQALANSHTLSSSGFSQIAHLIELGLQCQFGHRVWCHPLGQHQYYHPIDLGLQCRFGWWVWCNPLGQHQYHHWYLGIQLCPKEKGQPFDAVPLLWEYQPFKLNRRHLTFRQCCPPWYASPRLIAVAVAVASGSQKPISMTLLTVTGAAGIKGGPSLAYVATNLTIGSGVGDNTSTLSSEIPSSSMGSTSAVAGIRGILLTSNFGIPARLTGGTSALQAGTYTTKKHLGLTEPVIKNLATFGLHWQTQRS
jgi:hypothetical protein